MAERCVLVPPHPPFISRTFLQQGCSMAKDPKVTHTRGGGKAKLELEMAINYI